jgi:DNA invertase Pin-like site-specific DNA recombinase
VKVAIYCRVSTKDKQDITTQHSYLDAYAKRMELDIYRTYSDIGASGKKESRPDFDIMLTDMREGKFNAILVYKLDRIGRSLSHLLKLFEEFKKKDIAFISATETINTTTAEGRMFLHMLMTLAQYERELIVARVTDGMTRARSQGKPIGKRGKDKNPRRKSGYLLRWAGDRRLKDEVKGIRKPLEDYITKKHIHKQISPNRPDEKALDTPKG